MFWFLSAAIVFSFYLGDMGSIMNPTRTSVPNKISDDGDIPIRYEALYLHDRIRSTTV